MLTNGLFNLNPYQFVVGTGARGGGGFHMASGTQNISLVEVFDWVGVGNTGKTSLQEAIWINAKQNMLKMAGGFISIKVADKLLTSMGISRNFNKGVRALNMGGLVKM